MSVVVKVGAGEKPHYFPKTKKYLEDHHFSRTAAYFGPLEGIRKINRKSELGGSGWIVTCSTESGNDDELDWYNFETKEWDRMMNPRGYNAIGPKEDARNNPHFLADSSAEAEARVSVLYTVRRHKVMKKWPKGKHGFNSSTSTYGREGPEHVREMPDMAYSPASPAHSDEDDEDYSKHVDAEEDEEEEEEEYQPSMHAPGAPKKSRHYG